MVDMGRQMVKGLSFMMNMYTYLQQFTIVFKLLNTRRSTFQNGPPPKLITIFTGDYKTRLTDT